MRKYVKIYYDWGTATETLSDAEKGRLIDAIVAYASEKRALNLSGAERHVFPTFRAQIDRDEADYQASIENGKKGGRPKKGSETQPNLKKPRFSGETEKNQYKDKDKDEDYDKDYDKEDIYSSGASPEPTITLPLNDGTEYPILPEHVQEWAGLYPAVDVIQQLRAMRGWLLSDPKRRKTKAGILRFVNSWLSREQNRGPSRSKQEQTPKKLSYDPDKIEHDSLYNVPVITRRSG